MNVVFALLAPLEDMTMQYISPSILSDLPKCCSVESNSHYTSIDLKYGEKNTKSKNQECITYRVKI